MLKHFLSFIQVYSNANKVSMAYFRGGFSISQTFLISMQDTGDPTRILAKSMLLFHVFL